MTRWPFLLLALMLAMLAGCGPPAAIGAAEITAGAGRTVEQYKLGARDKVRILVFNEPTLSGEFSVNSNGALSLPLIGEIEAVGKTTEQLKQDIETALADGYLREPQVSIDVLSFRPFYILGEVSKAGEYPYANGLTVLNAVATAEGFTYRAEKRVAHIRREGESEEKAYELTPDLRVQPGDTIRIGERYF